MACHRILALLVLAHVSVAHIFLYAVWINGKDMGRGDGKPVAKGGPVSPAYIRGSRGNSPVTNVKSKDMTCNSPGAAVARYLDVKAGDKLTIEWHHNNRTSKDDVLADSHKGPVQTYLAPASSNGIGPVWVKIHSETYSNGQWATDKLTKNGGKYSLNLPGVQAGSYLLRSEVLALHQGQDEGGAQFYMACVQVKVGSGGGNKLPPGIAIPGAYGKNDEGIRFNIYTPSKGASYVAPGGAVKFVA